MILTWQARCEIHPDHQSGMVTHDMIKKRMQEEIDDLREYNDIIHEALEKVIAIWDCTCDNTLTCPNCVAREALQRAGGGE